MNVKRSKPEPAFEEDVPVDAPVEQPMQAPASPAATYTDGEDPVAKDPNFGSGGRYRINQEGVRERV